MEKYVINGTEVEYDTFDIDNMERMELACEKVRASVGTPGDGGIAAIRRICEAMLDFFDEVLGEGASRELFGDRVNFRIITESYRKFNADIKCSIAEVVRGAGSSAAAGSFEKKDVPGSAIFSRKLKS